MKQKWILSFNVKKGLLINLNEEEMDFEQFFMWKILRWTNFNVKNVCFPTSIWKKQVLKKKETNWLQRDKINEPQKFTEVNELTEVKIMWLMNLLRWIKEI